MAQQILTGNLLQDGVTYHASDINAAVNNATLLVGAVESQQLVTATSNLKVLASDGTNPLATTLLSVTNLAWTNIVSTGLANLGQGAALSGQLAIALNGNYNDWNPTGLSTATAIATSGVATITGIQAPATAGTILILITLSGALGLIPLSASSQAANQLNWGAQGNGGTGTVNPISLAPGHVATFYYAASNWFLLSLQQGVLHT